MAYRKLGRLSHQRKAMLRDLSTDLIINERIVTTEARAKELRSVVEKLITLGKRGDLHARRQAVKVLRNELATVEETEDAIIVESVVQKLFNDVAPRFETRNGGYTRVLNAEARRGDGAPMAILEFVEEVNFDNADVVAEPEEEVTEEEEVEVEAEETEEVDAEETEKSDEE